MASETGLALDVSVWFFAGQLSESEPVRHVPIRTTPFRVGRRPNLDLSIPCDCVSKEHAVIFERNKSLWVRDLGSTNGTYVNGERIEGETRLKEADILQFATVVFRVGKDKSDEAETGTIQQDSCDRALAMVQFDRLINDKAVVPFYQPIVHIDEEALGVIGYEVLGRSRLFGLKTPREMFATASQLNLEAELSRIFRLRGLEDACQFPTDVNLFVNTHPVELSEPGLFESLEQARELHPIRKITLEIHEAAVTNPSMIRDLRAQLTDLNIELAFDDFGQGQARLVELGEASPDYLKFDMQLIQGISKAPPRRQQVVATLVQMVTDLGVAPLAEGVETAEDHETLKQMGFELGQGYYYGRPAMIATYLEPNSENEQTENSTPANTEPENV